MCMITALVSLSGCDDRNWRRVPASVAQIHAIACPWASGADILHGRQVGDGSDAYLVYFARPAPEPDVRQYEIDKALYPLLPESGLPPSEDDIQKYHFPPLLELDARNGTMKEVPWARWSEATGRTFNDVHGSAGSVTVDFCGSVAGKAVVTAAPYVLSIEKPPSGKYIAVMTAFGPTATTAGGILVLEPRKTFVLGERAMEWLIDGNVAKSHPLVQRLVGTGSDNVSTYLKKRGVSAWTSDGHFALIVVNERLWIVPNPEFQSQASSPPPATPHSR